jgi:CYTH domain-containing protein
MSVSKKSDRPKLQLHHSPVEIERKFSVANDEWRLSAVRSVSIRDGLIAAHQGRMVRIRISGDIATVAIKGPRIGITRPEFKYEVPVSDAERMLSTICEHDTLEKERFFVEDTGSTWLVDVYGGVLNGVVIAEIELNQETQALVLPNWVGKEVTDDPFYAKVNLHARARRSLRVEATSS